MGFSSKVQATKGKKKFPATSRYGPVKAKRTSFRQKNKNKRKK